MKYLLFIIISTFFYSCGSEYSEVKKNDKANILEFYQSDKISKQYTLDDDNQILSILNYNDGNISSYWEFDQLSLKDSIEYYGNGKIKTKGYLKDGKKHSLWSYFDRDGHLLVERYFSYGRPSNIWIWYDHHHDNQIIHFEIYEDLRDNGHFTRHYQSGCIKDIKNYSENKLNGKYTLFNNDCHDIWPKWPPELDNYDMPDENATALDSLLYNLGLNPALLLYGLTSILGINDLIDTYSLFGSLQFETHYHLGKEVENN